MCASLTSSACPPPPPQGSLTATRCTPPCPADLHELLPCSAERDRVCGVAPASTPTLRVPWALVGTGSAAAVAMLALSKWLDRRFAGGRHARLFAFALAALGVVAEVLF